MAKCHELHRQCATPPPSSFALAASPAEAESQLNILTVLSTERFSKDIPLVSGKSNVENTPVNIIKAKISRMCLTKAFRPPAKVS